MTKKDFIKKVLIAMNEAISFDLTVQSFLGSDEVMVERIIQSSYVDAWKVMAKAVPKTWLGEAIIPINTGTFFPDSIRGTGYVMLPNDFFMLSKFMVDGWLNVVENAYYYSDPIAKYQKNVYTRGSITRPVCLITSKAMNGTIVLVMEYYSLPATTNAHIINEAMYVPVTTDIQLLGDGDALPVDDKLIQPLVYELAGIVYNVMGKSDAAKYFSDKVISFIR